LAGKAKADARAEKASEAVEEMQVAFSNVGFAKKKHVTINDTLASEKAEVATGKAAEANEKAGVARCLARGAEEGVHGAKNAKALEEGAMFEALDDKNNDPNEKMWRSEGI